MATLFEDRIFRCGQSHYTGNEILAVNQTHTDADLKAIAEAGFNGIWLRLKLRDIVPGQLFAPYVQEPERQIDAMAALCRRAGQFGLKVWGYCTEPLGLRISHPFWQAHPELAGHTTQIYDWEPHAALCSSTPAVQEYLSSGFSTLFRTLPLAGVILITSSEHISHCWGHVLSNAEAYPHPETFWAKECHCPRCRDTEPTQIIASIITTIHNSIQSVRPDAKTVAWDWSWNMHENPPYKKISALLPSEVVLMGDFERGGAVQRLNQRRTVEEYSLIYHGPSSRFKDKAAWAQEHNRPLWSRFQINTTHELATVPNLPLMVSLYQKFKCMREVGTAGFMGCWNFACCPDTLNTYAANALCQETFDTDERHWLTALAHQYFGRQVDADAAVRAWYGFDRACRHYPVGGSNDFLYFSPVNEALSYPLALEFKGIPMPGSWIKHDFSDRLEDTATTYSLEEIADAFDKLSTAWARALAAYEKALMIPDATERMRREFGVAKIIGGVFQSTHNIYKWYLIRKHRKTATLNTVEKEIVQNELDNIQSTLPFVEADPRAGFHQEPQWQMFDPDRIREKIKSLEDLLKLGQSPVFSP